MKIKSMVVSSILFVIILSLLGNNSYAKYVYNFDETIISLSRDVNPPVCTVSYSTEEWTNQNVIITKKLIRLVDLYYQKTKKF